MAPLGYAQHPVTAIALPVREMDFEQLNILTNGNGIREQQMSTERTPLGQDIATALGEVLDHLRREIDLPCRIVEDLTAERIRALCHGMKLSREKFAKRFGLDVRALQDWEQGRRVPDRAARVLLTVIDHEPQAVVPALAR